MPESIKCSEHVLFGKEFIPLWEWGVRERKAETQLLKDEILP